MGVLAVVIDRKTMLNTSMFVLNCYIFIFSVHTVWVILWLYMALLKLAFFNCRECHIGLPIIFSLTLFFNFFFFNLPFPNYELPAIANSKIIQ